MCLSTHAHGLYGSSTAGRRVEAGLFEESSAWAALARCEETVTTRTVAAIVQVGHHLARIVFVQEDGVRVRVLSHGCSELRGFWRERKRGKRIMKPGSPPFFRSKTIFYLASFWPHATTPRTPLSLTHTHERPRAGIQSTHAKEGSARVTTPPHTQNWSPPSRAASARALTRPW